MNIKVKNWYKNDTFLLSLWIINIYWRKFCVFIFVSLYDDVWRSNNKFGSDDDDDVMGLAWFNWDGFYWCWWYELIWWLPVATPGWFIFSVFGNRNQWWSWKCYKWCKCAEFLRDSRNRPNGDLIFGRQSNLDLWRAQLSQFDRGDLQQFIKYGRIHSISLGTWATSKHFCTFE